MGVDEKEGLSFLSKYSPFSLILWQEARIGFIVGGS
jgi:hypothetical protein